MAASWQEGETGSSPGERLVKHGLARFRNLALLPRGEREGAGERLRHQTVFAGAAYAEAAALIERLGDYAASEAALRADRSRELGNVVHFCRWREVARLIDLIRDDAVIGAVH
jgi:hypothetical protein